MPRVLNHSWIICYIADFQASAFCPSWILGAIPTLRYKARADSLKEYTSNHSSSPPLEVALSSNASISASPTPWSLKHESTTICSMLAIFRCLSVQDLRTHSSPKTKPTNCPLISATRKIELSLSIILCRSIFVQFLPVIKSRQVNLLDDTH